MWDIDMGYRYGRSDINKISIRNFYMEYGLSIWDMMYRYDYLPY
jgi:hypothetical protein